MKEYAYINEMVRDARKRKGLTQEQMAEKLNIKRSTYAYWESKAKLKDENIKQICDVLGIKVSELPEKVPESERNVPLSMAHAAKIIFNTYVADWKTDGTHGLPDDFYDPEIEGVLAEYKVKDLIKDLTTQQKIDLLSYVQNLLDNNKKN